jgi:ABC-type antimicrobial peptide transport system permease subunit
MESEETEDMDMGALYVEAYGALDTRVIEQQSTQTMIAGRQLTAEDAGKPLLVLSDLPQRQALGIDVGDTLIYEITAGSEVQTLRFEVVGITQGGLFGPGIGAAPIYTSVGALPESLPATAINLFVDIAEEQIPELRRQMSSVPGTFVLETSVFTKLLTSLLGTFTAFPTMVALLGLVVGGVVIANSVALTTMERRREIAVMKAVGLQRERVLGMLLLENGLMGLIGGLLGVGISLIALVVLLAASGAPGQAIPYGTALVLMLLCIGVALIAAATTAWGASGEKPLNVLRYE